MKTIVPHRFSVGDVEDPNIYAAEPLWEWQNSEAGKWAMENCSETPSWHRVMDPAIFGYAYQVRITLTPKQLIYWKLKYE
jgi:hypothetical protein